MQRVDHPDPAAANAQALDDLQNGATGLVLVFAGSVSANGFGLDPSPATLARVLEGVDLDAGVRSISISVNRRAARRRAIVAALIKNPRHRADNSRPARQHQSDRRLCRLPAAGRGPGTTLAPVFRRDWSASLPLPASADRSPSPTDASSTMQAARKRRNLPSRWPARSPTCARWKPSGMALERRARRDLFPAVGRCRPVSDHGEIPRRAKIVGTRRGSLRAEPEAAHRSRPKPPGA